MPGRPEFFIVGAPKSGTTSLYRYLEQHPDIYMSSFKEPNYYCPDTAASAETPFYSTEHSYLALFDDAKPGQLCGEASSIYLRAPESPALIRDDVPNAKIIIVLREPGERAYSHYQMRYRSGDLTTGFSECFTLDDPRDKNLIGFQRLVIGPGFYGQQVPRYLDEFGPDNVLVLIADDFFAEPEAGTRRVLSFLGIGDKVELTTTKRHNDYREPRSRLGLALLRRKRYLRFLKPLVPVQLKWWVTSSVMSRAADKPAMSPSDRAKLNEIYHEDVQLLRGCLGMPDLWHNIYDSTSILEGPDQTATD